MIKEIKELNLCQVNELKKSFPQSAVENFVNFTNPFTQVFVIKTNEEIVGIMILDIIYERMELIQIEVKEEYRNQGYASKLLEFMINLAKEKKLENITLEVRSDNTTAIHLYEKYGFVSVSKREKYYQDKDGILMERKMM